jgi:hypothetical protein
VREQRLAVVTSMANLKVTRYRFGFEEMCRTVQSRILWGCRPDLLALCVSQARLGWRALDTQKPLPVSALLR